MAVKVGTSPARGELSPWGVVTKLMGFIIRFDRYLIVEDEDRRYRVR